MPKSKEQKYQEAVARNIGRYSRPIQADAAMIAPMNVASLRTMAGLRKEDDRHVILLGEYLESARAKIKKATEVAAKPEPIAADPVRPVFKKGTKAALFSVDKAEKPKKRSPQASS